MLCRIAPASHPFASATTTRVPPTSMAAASSSSGDAPPAATAGFAFLSSRSSLTTAVSR